MSTWLVVWFVIGVVSTIAVLAFFIALTRHALVLGRSAKQMQEAVQPIADDISRLTARQQRRIEELKAHVPRFGGPVRRGSGDRER